MVRTPLEDKISGSYIGTCWEHRNLSAADEHPPPRRGTGAKNGLAGATGHQINVHYLGVVAVLLGLDQEEQGESTVFSTHAPRCRSVR